MNLAQRARTFGTIGTIPLVCLTLASVSISANLVAAEPPDTSSEESWQVVYVGKSRIGYTRTSSRSEQRDDKTIILSESEAVMAMKRFGQSVNVRTKIATEEAPDGTLLRFTMEMHNPPAASTRTVGRVEGKRLYLEQEVAGTTKKSEQPWDPTVKSPNALHRLLKKDPLKPGDKRTLKVLEPQFVSVDTVVLTAGKHQTVTLFDKSEMKLLPIAVTHSLTPGIVSQDYVDDKGETYKTTMNLLDMATYRVTKDEALKSLTGAELDVAITTLVPVTPPLENPRKTSRVVYRVTMNTDDPAKTIAAGPTQEVKTVSKTVVDLTVTTVDGSQADAKAAGDKPAAEFVDPNQFLQSDDDRVKELAEKAVGEETDPWKKAVLMERWVYENLKKKNFSTLLASAAEVARDLQGDCTEHAVLLAAMARAQAIPSRVVIGLVYMGGKQAAFAGHMWTEVKIGQTWVPLDATLGLGGIAADHIKFQDTSFAEDNALTCFLPMVMALGQTQITVQEAK